MNYKTFRITYETHSEILGKTFRHVGDPEAVSLAAFAALDDGTQDLASEAVEGAIYRVISAPRSPARGMTRSEARALLRMALDVSADLDEAAGEE